MGSHHVFDQLMLLGRLWLVLRPHEKGPHARSAEEQSPPTPGTPPRKRARPPPPFAGLPRQPLCDACPQAREAPTLLPPPAPPKAPSTRGRRRHRDTSHPCWP